MKIKIDEEFADKIIIKSLKRTKKMHEEFQDSDSPEIIDACNVLIAYYGPIKN